MTQTFFTASKFQLCKSGFNETKDYIFKGNSQSLWYFTLFWYYNYNSVELEE